MALTYAGYTDGTPGSGTRASVAAPSRAVGDLLIGHLYVNVASISSLSATGWTLIGGAAVTSSPVVMADFYRLATNTSADDFAATWTGSSVYAHAGMSRITDVSSSRPLDVVGAGNSGTSRAPLGRSITTTIADTLGFCVLCTDDEATVTPPSGTTRRDAGRGAFVATFPLAAGASGDRTAALSVSTLWTARLFAVGPNIAAAQPSRLLLMGVG